MGILDSLFLFPQLAVLELALISLISIGISIAASALLARSIKIRSPIVDDKPQTLSLRGDYINVLIGKRRVGPYFAWVGNRKPVDTTSGGKGSGGGSGGVRGYVMDGWQVLGLGPAAALHRIWDNGKTIFTGPITPETHPSGSRISLGKRVGTFEIYWGEKLQPINTYLGNFDRVGIHSRWPFLCYVIWIRKYLGITTTWPLIEYELEVRPYNTGLTTPAWLDNLAGITGANVGHIIDQLLFQKYPHGAGLPRDRFDIPSLETLSNGVNFGDDFIPANFFVSDGPTLEESLAAILQDVGIFLPMDVLTGLIKFRLLRKPVGAVPNITEELLTEPRSEIDVNHGPKISNRVVISFADKDRAYKDSTITLDDDGQAIRTDTSRGKRVRSSIFTDFVTVSKVAFRRENEDPFEPAGAKLHATRATRKILPGDPIKCVDFAGPLRVITVENDPKSSEVIIECISDTYGTQVNTGTVGAGGGLPDPTTPTNDINVDFFELPAYWTDKCEIIVLRTRGDETITTASIFISGDGLTYQFLALQAETVTTGTLTEALPNSGPQIIQDGPIVDALGSDPTTIEDLTADPINWRLGRQVMLIGEEVCFLKGAQIINAGQFRPQGIIRARYGGEKLSHAPGTKVYIFNRDNVPRYENLLIAPNKQVFLKVAPSLGGIAVSLEGITAIDKQITGKAFRGIKPKNVNTTPNLSRSFPSGGNLTFRWSYYSTANIDSGAGEQNAGAVYSISPVQGFFNVKLLTTADVLKHTSPNLTTNTYSRTNAELVTDFAGQPTSFKIQVTHTKNGLISTIAEETIVRT